MKAERDLTNAYREWRRLAEAEGEAIGEGNWSLVAACQAALLQLQKQVSSLTQIVRAEWSQSGGDVARKERTLTETIQELIVIERRNQTLLQAVQQAMRAKLATINQVGQNLKHIQRSYGGVHSPALNTLS